MCVRIDLGAQARKQRGDALPCDAIARAHPDAASRRGGGHRRRSNRRSAAAILVEPATGLASKHPGGEALRAQRGRPEPRFLVVLVIDRFHHRLRHVEAGEVEQLEGPEPEPRRVAHDVVDGLVARDAFREDPHVACDSPTDLATTLKLRWP